MGIVACIMEQHGYDTPAGVAGVACAANREKEKKEKKRNQLRTFITLIPARVNQHLVI